MNEEKYQVSFDQLDDVMVASKTYMLKQIEAESKRAMEKETSLQDSVDSLTQTTTDEFKRLGSSIEAEVSRATASESDLSDRITAERDRAIKSENDTVEALAKMGNDLLGEVGKVQDALRTEVTRATGEEESIKSKIEQVENDLAKEIGRSTTEDDSTKTKIQSLVDGQNDLTKITTDLLNAGVQMQDDLADEVSRATAKENDIAKSVADLKADSDDKFDRIEDNWSALSAEVGEIQTTVEAMVDAEKNRAMGEEEKLSSAIESETTRATTKETEIEKSVSAVSSTIASEVSDVKSLIASETTRATEAEQSISKLVSAETARATDAEDTLGTRITNLKNDIDTTIGDVTSSVREEETRATREEEKLSNQIKENKTTVDGQISALTRELNDVKTAVDEFDSGIDQKIQVETDRALAAEGALDQKITDEVDQEASTRSTQFNSISGDLSALQETVTTSVSTINGQIDQINANVSTLETDLNTVKKTAVVGYKTNPSTEANPFALVGVNAEGTTVNTIQVAYDPDDPTHGDSSLVNKKYAKTIVESLTESITTVQTTLDQKITDLKTSTDQSVAGLTVRAVAVETSLNNSVMTDTLVAEDGEDGVLITSNRKNLSTSDITVRQFKVVSPNNTIHATVSTDANGARVISVESVVDKAVVETIQNGVMEQVHAALDQIHQPDTMIESQTLEQVANVPVGDDPEYGYRWRVETKKFDTTSGTSTTTKEELNMFRISGAWDVMHELYDEVARSKLEDEKLRKAIADEVARATEKENELTTSLDTVKTDLGSLQTKVSSLEESTTTKLASLKTDLTDSITAETTRATSKENELKDLIDMNAGAIASATTKVEAENTRAVARENELATDIGKNTSDISTVTDNLTSEVTRATEAEAKLKESIEAIVVPEIPEAPKPFSFELEVTGDTIYFRVPSKSGLLQSPIVQVYKVNPQERPLNDSFELIYPKITFAKGSIDIAVEAGEFLSVGDKIVVCGMW